MPAAAHIRRPGESLGRGHLVVVRHRLTNRRFTPDPVSHTDDSQYRRSAQPHVYKLPVLQPAASASVHSSQMRRGTVGSSSE